MATHTHTRAHRSHPPGIWERERERASTREKGHIKNVIVMRKRFALVPFASCITYVSSEYDLMFASALLSFLLHSAVTTVHDEFGMVTKPNGMRSMNGIHTVLALISTHTHHRETKNKISEIGNAEKTDLLNLNNYLSKRDEKTKWKRERMKKWSIFGIFVMIQAASEKLRAFSIWSYLSFVSCEHDKMLTLLIIGFWCEMPLHTAMVACIALMDMPSSESLFLMWQLCKLLILLALSLPFCQNDRIFFSVILVGLRCHEWFSILTSIDWEHVVDQ